MRVWLLNFAAEREAEGKLSRREGLYERVDELVPRTSGLVPEGDAVARADDPAGRYAGFVGVTWCPTPLALAELARLGATPVAHPSWPLLRALLARDDAAEHLGLTLPGARFVRDEATLDGALQLPSPTGRVLARRRFGFSGRGRRLLAQPPSADDLAFARRAVREGGLLVEPWLERDADFGLHGFVGRDEIMLGRPTTQCIGSGGVWEGSRPTEPGELHPDELAALRDAAEEAARSLQRRGFFGPFGVDAFRYRGQDGALHFNPRCELNPRYSMAWALGMPDRPDLAQLAIPR